MQRLDFCAVPSTLCSLCLISHVGPWSKPLLCVKFLIWVEIGWGCIDSVQCLNSPFLLNSGQVCLLQNLAPGCPRCAAPLNKYVVGKARLPAVLGRWGGASRGLEHSEVFALVSTRHVGDEARTLKAVGEYGSRENPDACQVDLCTLVKRAI